MNPYEYGVKIATVPGWKKQFRRMADALHNNTHLWHGASGDPTGAGLSKILASGRVQPAHLRPNVIGSEGELVRKAPHSGAFFSTHQPTKTYWAGSGGVGIGKARVPGEIVKQQPVGYEHEFLSHGTVNLPRKAIVVPPSISTPEELATFRQNVQERGLHPVHPLAQMYAQKATGPTASMPTEKAQNAFFSRYKAQAVEQRQALREDVLYGRTPDDQIRPTLALSGPSTKKVL